MEFLNSFPEVIFEIDKDLTLKFINASSEQITGYKQEELIGKRLQLEDFFAPEDISRIKSSFNEVFKGNHITGNHYKMLTKHGEVIILKIHNYPIKENGKVVALRCLAVNITEQENKISALTGKEYHYRQIFLNSPIAYQSLNNKGIIMDINPAWEQTMGYRYDEIIGKSFKSILDDEYQSKFDKIFTDFKEKGEVRNIEFKLKKKNGGLIFGRYNGKVE